MRSLSHLPLKPRSWPYLGRVRVRARVRVRVRVRVRARVRVRVRVAGWAAYRLGRGPTPTSATPTSSPVLATTRRVKSKTT